MDFAALRVRAERWIEDDPDEATRAELRGLLEQSDLSATDLEDRFAGALEFGTAGLRGVLGAGPNRMNRAVVARATWGLATEILASVPRAKERVLFVGGDCRRMSRELVDDVAAIAAALGLRVMLFAEPTPTPVVGFAVKELGAAAGVVVTASHNPPEYNGYKVYWENAVQIVPPVDARIAAAIDRAPVARSIERPPVDRLRAEGRVLDVPADIESRYLSAIASLAVHRGEGDRSLSIVYTPLHGVGNALVRRALSDAGFTSVVTVPEQEAPDGAFPTVAFPNPEEPGAMDLALALAARSRADLVLANDPDVDRLAVAIPDLREGSSAPLRYVQLTGNEIGALLGHYLLMERPRKRPGAVLASIVSSPLLGLIAADCGVRYEETLTGFKWIAKRSLELEAEGVELIFGYEEALGYCVGSVVRDKDGISAAVLASELAAVLRARGSSLGMQLESIARQWGLFTSTQVSITRKGVTGAATLRAVMTALRSSAPDRFGDDAVVGVADYLASERVDVRTGRRAPLTLPRSNVLSFALESGGRIVARPSGTEPKVKLYFDVRERVAPGEAVAAASARARAALGRLVASVRSFVATFD